MWYFAWVLGVTAALCISVINVMWFEFQDDFEEPSASGSDQDA